MDKNLANLMFLYKDNELFWQVDRGHKVKAGSLAGCVRKNGYRQLSINKKVYFAHRIIFLMHYGYLPKEIDHIDGNPLNNSIANLREVTHSQNQWNHKLRSDNKTGIKGVTWSKTKNKWKVQISFNSKNKHIAYSKDLELAELIAMEARNKYHKEFANHGN
jgi:hypothetical protein